MVSAVLDILQLDNCIAYYADKDLEFYLNDRTNRCQYFYTDKGELRRPTSSDIRDAYLPEISALMRHFTAGAADQSYRLNDDYVASIIN
jgi:hypothetical protein